MANKQRDEPVLDDIDVGAIINALNAMFPHMAAAKHEWVITPRDRAIFRAGMARQRDITNDAHDRIPD